MFSVLAFQHGAEDFGKSGSFPHGAFAGTALVVFFAAAGRHSLFGAAAFWEQEEEDWALGLAQEALFIIAGLAFVKLAIYPHLGESKMSKTPANRWKSNKSARHPWSRDGHKEVSPGPRFSGSDQVQCLDGPSTRLHEQAADKQLNDDVERLLKYTNMIEAFVKQGNLAMAEKTLMQMHGEGLHGPAINYNNLLHAYAQLGDIASTSRCLKQMIAGGVVVDTVSYNIVIDACSKADNVDDAEAWLKRLVKSGISPNVVSFSTLIHACARVGDVDRAQLWLERMIAAGIPANSISYNSMVFACARKGNAALAEHWLNKMLGAGIPANVNTYSALIDCCAKANDLARAEQWFEHMVDAGVDANVVSYGAVINACAKAGDVRKAEEYFQRMLATGVEANAASFTGVIDACAKGALPERAEYWLTRMMDAGLEPEVVSFSAVIDACGKAGKDCHLARAQRVFEQMVKRGVKPNIFTYTSLARPYSRRGDYRRVEEIQEVLISQGIKPNEYFLNVLLSSYAHAVPPQASSAEAALREAHGRGIRLNEYIITSLERCVGEERFISLQAELGLQGTPKPRSEPRNERMHYSRRAGKQHARNAW